MIIDHVDRQRLLSMFPPEYKNVVAHHITESYDVDQCSPLPVHVTGQVIGDVYDRGVQALVVSLGGSHLRADGRVYHITWSLDDGRYAENSNALIARGWFPLAEPITISISPAFIMAQALN